MSLSGNMPLSEVVDRKLKWKTLEDETRELISLTDFKSVTLRPLQIRTFQINLTIK